MEINKNDYVSTLIVSICFCVGYIVKSSLGFINNKYIPLIVSILGTTLSVWQNGLNPKSIACGLVSGLASTGAFEFIKNILETLE